MTGATEIECEPATAMRSAVARIADHGGSTARGSDDPAPATTGDDKAAGRASDDATPGSRGDDGAPGQASDDTPAGPAARAPCDRTALVTGATVTRARTRTDSAGSVVFKQIKLAV